MTAEEHLAHLEAEATEERSIWHKLNDRIGAEGVSLVDYLTVSRWKGATVYGLVGGWAGTSRRLSRDEAIRLLEGSTRR